MIAISGNSGEIMPAYNMRDRILPYKILSYLLYSPQESVDWLETISEDEVRIVTGPCSRAFRLKISTLWEQLYWLEGQGLISGVSKEKKRGSALIKLKQPTNIENSND